MYTDLNGLPYNIAFFFFQKMSFLGKKELHSGIKKHKDLIFVVAGIIPQSSLSEAS